MPFVDLDRILEISIKLIWKKLFKRPQLIFFASALIVLWLNNPIWSLKSYLPNPPYFEISNATASAVCEGIYGFNQSNTGNCYSAKHILQHYRTDKEAAVGAYQLSGRITVIAKKMAATVCKGFQQQDAVCIKMLTNDKQKVTDIITVYFPPERAYQVHQAAKERTNVSFTALSGIISENGYDQAHHLLVLEDGWLLNPRPFEPVAFESQDP